MVVFVVAWSGFRGDDAKDYVVAFGIWRGEVGRFDGAEEVWDLEDGFGGECAGQEGVGQDAFGKIEGGKRFKEGGFGG